MLAKNARKVRWKKWKRSRTKSRRLTNIQLKLTAKMELRKSKLIKTESLSPKATKPCCNLVVRLLESLARVQLELLSNNSCQVLQVVARAVLQDSHPMVIFHD